MNPDALLQASFVFAAVFAATVIFLGWLLFWILHPWSMNRVPEWLAVILGATPALVLVFVLLYLQIESSV